MFRESQSLQKLIRVALVSADEDFAARAADFLRSQPELRVVVATDSVSILLRLLPGTPPDVVLVDVSPPNGVRLNELARLRSHFPEVGLVALTSAERANQTLLPLMNGSLLVLSKAATDSTLVRALRRACRGC